MAGGKMKRLIEYILVAAIVLSAAYLYAWYNKPPAIPAGVTIEAVPAAEVKKEEKVDVVVKAPVKVYKPGIKGKLKLPANITSDDNQHVLASSKTANDERPHTITTTINQQTGEVQTFDRTDSLPWISMNHKSEIGAYVGYKLGEPAIRIEGRQELLQVKEVHMGAIASADMTRAGTDGFIGIGAWARW